MRYHYYDNCAYDLYFSCNKHNLKRDKHNLSGNKHYLKRDKHNLSGNKYNLKRDNYGATLSMASRI